METSIRNYKNIIGDGKTPNKYFVSISNDYMYVHTEDYHSMIDWIGDLIPSFKSKGKMFKAFTTYHEAKSFCDDMYIGQTIDGIIVNRITIEDRLTGELYEKTKLFNPLTASIREEENEDIGFTQKKLLEQFI